MNAENIIRIRIKINVYLNRYQLAKYRIMVILGQDVGEYESKDHTSKYYIRYTLKLTP